MSDSQTNTNVCKTSIKVPIPVLGLGGGLYQPGSAGNNQSARLIPSSRFNFGNDTYSTIKDFGGFNIINGAGYYGNNLYNLIVNNDIKILIIGYDYWTDDAQTPNVIADFTKRGGYVFMACQHINLARNTMNSLFGVSNITGSGKNYGNQSNILQANLNDPLIDGDFGNLAGLSWGEDLADSIGLTNVPTASINIFGTTNTTQVTAFKHKEYPFVWFGDGGFLAGEINHTGIDTWPAHVDSSGRPIAKPNYRANVSGAGLDKPVYNGVLYANFLAWAIKGIK